MASTTLPFAAARQFMVDSQLRPNKVSNASLLDAMREVPREQFLPPSLWTLAYADQDVQLGGGRVLMAPLALARLLQLLGPVTGERVLVVGAGSGYGAALLARCGARVTALDQDEWLLAIGRAALAGASAPVVFHQGPPRDGLPGVQPWDAIFIQGAVEAVPEGFAQQLRPNTGRLVTVLGRPGAPGVAVLGERQGAGLAFARAFDCTTAMLPGFETVSEFHF
ncbi:MAG: methyltransferase domain-containing protein [Proteobacteria bacterium]|nr:methyltransferase domain-containing protein [Pseudomonadota bacterium]